MRRCNTETSCHYTLGHHRSWRVLSSFHAPIRPFVLPSVPKTLPLCVFLDFRYRHEIWWHDVLYHGADRYFKLTVLGQFCAFQGNEFFHDRLGIDLRDNATSLTLQSFQVLTRNLVREIHSTMKQMALNNGHALPILSSSRDHWN